MNLKLEFPNEKHKKMYEILIEEWGRNEKIPIDPERLFIGNNFNDFLKIIIKDKTNCDRGVNSHLFFLINNDEILGALQIRHNLEHPNLKENGGHIGYGISPIFRRKGYATQMLKLGLIEAIKLGLDKVLITCKINNIGSKKVIEKNGGLFERLSEDGKLRRYWIKL